MFSKGIDYVEFNAVAADREGRLKISLDPVAPAKTAASILNGFQLQGDLPPPAPVPRCQKTEDIEFLTDHRVTFIIQPAISFRYHGKMFTGLPNNWKSDIESHKLDATRTAYTLKWRDPETGLEVRVAGIEYRDFPAIEWTAYFKNTGEKNTPILEDIQALDINLERGSAGEFILNGLKGDSTTPDSYEPYRLELGPNAIRNFSPPSNSGKSTDGPDGWPYYNLQTPGGGVIMAVGWPGQWASSFTRDATNHLRIRAGQQLTHLYLKPGEEIRTPLIALLIWRGTDVVLAQNLWRRWYMAYNIPRFDGRPQRPMTSIQVTGMESDTNLVQSYLNAGIKPDACWRDALNGGFTWYPSDTGPYKYSNNIMENNSYLNTGTWDVDSRKLPSGFKPFTDYLHSQGMKFILWFEPERVGDPQSRVATNHPDWLLPATETTVGAILNEGNPAARNWLINHMDAMIKSQGIDWYREDMNGCGPLTAWRKNDQEDREGITENFYVQGHLAYWDELKRRNPGLHEDSCASGGRRNDLETMRRAVPMTRSDFVVPTFHDIVEGNQGHTYGISFWLPWYGSEDWFTDSYSSRSFYMAGFQYSDTNDYQSPPKTEIKPASIEAIKKAYRECARIAPFMLCDYYPLTPYSRDLDHWLGWQFNRPEEGDGLVQAFRRKNCATATLTVKLRGLDPKAVYVLKNFDGGTETKAGGDLMTNSLTITISNAPGAAIITYAKILGSTVIK